jgi:hypothetical protein
MRVTAPGGAQAELLAELAGGERAGSGQDVQTAQVGDVQAHPVGDGLVEQDAVGGAGLGGTLQLGQQLGSAPRPASPPSSSPSWLKAPSALATAPGGMPSASSASALRVGQHPRHPPGAAALLAFAAGLGRALPAGVGSTWGPRLLGVAGACFGLLAVFPDDPGLGYPPGLSASRPAGPRPSAPGRPPLADGSSACWPAACRSFGSLA